MLAWRLRRVSGLLTVPVNARAPDAASFRKKERRRLGRESWRQWGRNTCSRGRCSGPPYEATLHLAVLEFSSAAGRASSKPSADTRMAEVDLPPGKLFDVLDAATRWTLDQFEIREVPQSVQDMIFGPPCRTPARWVLRVRSSRGRRPARVRLCRAAWVTMSVFAQRWH